MKNREQLVVIGGIVNLKLPLEIAGSLNQVRASNLTPIRQEVEVIGKAALLDLRKAGEANR
jgi:hypothetical protein